jgi:hypothetical protein
MVGWPPVGTDDTYQYSVTTLSAYWPEAEHRRLIERWPHLEPRANAIAEPAVGSLRRELLDRTLILNQRRAATALRADKHHYNAPTRFERRRRFAVRPLRPNLATR